MSGEHQKMIYDPWNASEYLVLRVYVHPDEVTEDITSELESLKTKGCKIVEQTQSEGDRLVEDFRAALQSAKSRLESQRKEARLVELRLRLLEELDTEEGLSEALDFLASRRKK